MPGMSAATTAPLLQQPASEPEDGDGGSSADSSDEISDSMRQATGGLVHGQMDVSYRYRSCSLLWVGCMSAYMAFLTSFVITLIRFVCRYSSEMGAYPSGYGNFPETVSESVSDSKSAQGKLFFAFGLIAGICIFLSFYPYMLRNVYTGSEGAFGMAYWISVRQYLPPIGLILLICVTTVPAYRAQDVDYFSVAFHLIGAGMMFVGYLVCELKCLEMFGFRSKSGSLFLDIEPAERVQRQVCAALIFVGFSSFLVAQVVLVMYPDDSDMCCHDKYNSYTWLVKPSESIHNVNHTIKDMVPLAQETQIDTASGWVLAWKMTSFFMECLAGVAMVTSHYLIWYHCEERHVDYAPHPLLAVYDEENNVMTDHAWSQLTQFTALRSEESDRVPGSVLRQLPKFAAGD